MSRTVRCFSSRCRVAPTMWPERSRTARRELRRSHCRRCRQTEQELANLITFVAKGDLASPRLHEEIQTREHRLVELDRQLERLHTTRASVPCDLAGVIRERPPPGRSRARATR